MLASRCDRCADGSASVRTSETVRRSRVSRSGSMPHASRSRRRTSLTPRLRSEVGSRRRLTGPGHEQTPVVVGQLRHLILEALFLLRRDVGDGAVARRHLGRDRRREGRGRYARSRRRRSTHRDRRRSEPSRGRGPGGPSGVLSNVETRQGLTSSGRWNSSADALARRGGRHRRRIARARPRRDGNDRPRGQRARRGGCASSAVRRHGAGDDREGVGSPRSTDASTSGVSCSDATSRSRHAGSTPASAAWSRELVGDHGLDPVERRRSRPRSRPASAPRRDHRWRRAPRPGSRRASAMVPAVASTHARSGAVKASSDDAVGRGDAGRAHADGVLGDDHLERRGRRRSRRGRTGGSCSVDPDEVPVDSPFAQAPASTARAQNSTIGGRGARPGERTGRHRGDRCHAHGA